ncbi:MAG: T9SS type A sorting domain-containing protein [Burkholderiales bacterium]|nr:T9SS type A sorting domain-containing protein [Bacteroidia bacterium]
MKKIYLILSTLGLSIVAQAQLTDQASASSVKFTPSLTLSAKTATAMAGDTAGWNNVVDFLPEFGFGGGQLTIFGSQGGGYVYGKNNGGISTCAQGYYNLNSTSLSIEKVVIWAIGKDMAPTPLATSNLSVSIWSMAANKARTYVAPTGTATAGTFTLDSYGPNIKKTPTALVNIANVDTTTSGPAGFAWTVATFSTPIQISADFAIVVNSFGLAATDTVGFISDAIGAAQNIDMTFHATSGNMWYKTDGGAFADGALDDNIGFFAVLGVISAVNEYYNGVKLNAIYPNPSQDVATISYSLEKESRDVSLGVYNIHGQKVYNETFGTQQAGDYKINLNASSYAAGSYFYQLRSNGNVVTKEFVVTK